MSRRGVVAIALSALLAAACSTPQAAAAEIRSDVPRASADPSAAKAAAAALDAFSADLYRTVAREPGNVVLSPYSVMTALAMVRAGAAGATRSEMDRVLHASGDLDAGLNAIDQELAKRPGKYTIGGEERELELATANRLFGQKDFSFERPFLDTLAAQYGAGMRIVDYKAAREQARAAINSWVSDRTRGRIPEIVPPGVLDDLTRLVLTNAIYLKASWAMAFGEARPAPFTRADGSLVTAQMMDLRAPLRYASGPGFQAVSIPYAGGLSMLLLVPEAGSLASFESSLDGTRLRQIASSLRPAHVELSMPRFTFRTQAGLKPVLIALGMPTAFSDRADFSGITREDRLLISAVLHEAFIAVDESGTEAAAATAVVVGVTSAPASPVKLRADRPFLFAIADDATGALLFVGRVADPTR